ncbi:MAG: hypothetical protein DRO36_06040 [Candidatus Hecatellales archaeon]|nr:MAG: hypothetical protein DRO36_06040 [Candidatus Hecatellales archaeon]
METKPVTFYSEGKKIYGNLHLPNAENPPCVITLHGLESSKDSGKWLVFALKLCEAGFACLRFSFRGCGEGEEKSEGDFEDTSLTGRIKDYEEALNFLRDTGLVDMGRLGVVGSSFGGMVAIASGKRVKATVILSTPYTLSKPINLQLKTEKNYWILPSGRRLKKDFFEDLKKYDLLKAVKNVSPILIIHGSMDELVPVEHAYMLYKNAKEPKRLEVVEGGDHTFSNPKNLDRVIGLALEWFKKYL